MISDAGQDINNVSTAKHGVTAASGLLAIASADTNMSYYHGFLSLGSAPTHPFTDIAGTPFEDDIVWLWEAGHHDRLHSHEVLPQGSGHARPDGHVPRSRPRSAGGVG